MLPACFVPSVRPGLVRARYILLGFRSLYLLIGMLSRPLLFMPLRDADSHQRNRRKCPAASVSELPEGPKSPLYFTAPAQYRPDASAARFARRSVRFGPGSGERPHAARSGAAGVIRLSERHVQSRIPDAAGGIAPEAVPEIWQPGRLRIEFFPVKLRHCSVGAALFQNRCSGSKTAHALMNNAKIPR